MNFRMPYEWWPRKYQLPALQALDGGCRDVLLMWHRRAGKDALTLNWCAAMMAEAPTSVLYMLPEFRQAKRVLFRELNLQGKRHIDQAFPEQLVTHRNEGEGFLRLWNGSIFQIGGFDTIDSYVGIGPKIVVFSEYATSKHAERAYQLVQPMLLMNGGTTIFCYTPRGKGEGYKLWNTASQTHGWFAQRLTVDDTGIQVPDKLNLGGFLSLPDAVRREVESGVTDEATAQQEYYCSFEAPNTGSYYGKLLEQAEKQGRLCELLWDPSLPVYTWWDIGVDDATAIWFVQRERGGKLRMIDYYEADGEGLPHYIEVLNERRSMGWTFEPRGQLVPHDFGDRDFQSGDTPQKAAMKLGWRMTVVPRPTSVQHGIDMVRRAIPMMWFDKERCGAGFERLRAYTKRWSDQLKQFMGPQHDEASHCADAIRTGIAGMVQAGMHLAPNLSQAKAMSEQHMARGSMPVIAKTDFSVWDR